MRGREQWFGDQRIRAWKGSKLPPLYIHPDQWNRAMNNEEKLLAIKEYEEQLEQERQDLKKEAVERASSSGLDRSGANAAAAAQAAAPAVHHLESAQAESGR